MQTGAFQYPGQHGGGGGFAVGAGHGQHVAALQHMIGQPLRAAGVRRTGIQNGFHQGELRGSIGPAGPADHIAYHIHIRLQCHLVGTKALDQVNSQGPELVAHGRVDTGVTAGYFVSRFTGQSCQATHEGAANAKNVNMHGAHSTKTLD